MLKIDSSHTQCVFLKVIQYYFKFYCSMSTVKLGQAHEKYMAYKVKHLAMSFLFLSDSYTFTVYCSISMSPII